MASSDESSGEALQRGEELEDATRIAASEGVDEDDEQQDEAEIEVHDASKEDESQAGGEPSLPKSFPLSKVKKIVRLDKDIKLVARPALMAISQAAQLFIESLTAEAFSASLRSKRRSLRLADLETAVRSKRKFLDFLDDSMDIFAEATSQDKVDGEYSKSDKSLLPPAGTRCITDFFS